MAGSSLISAEALALKREQMDADGQLVIADVRFYLADHQQGAREFSEGHIPGSVFVDLHDDLADVTIAGAGRHPLPTTHAFGLLLDRLGVSPTTTVVAYDNHGGAMAARLWWMLRSVGHRDVRLLDGGIAAWIDAGFELETGPGAPPTECLVEERYRVPDTWSGVVSADDVAACSPEVVVVDSRSPDRYRGDTEPLDPRAGHIPGAINLFHGDSVRADGYFKSAEELGPHFAELGDQPVVYCGSGVTACHNLFAMHLAGIDDAVLFPGSWSQWSSDITRPIMVGDEPIS